jgi:hypothetical protein
MTTEEFARSKLGHKVKVKKTRNQKAKNSTGTIVGFCNCGADCALVVELDNVEHGVDNMATFLQDPKNKLNCAYVYIDSISPLELPENIKHIPKALHEHIKAMKSMKSKKDKMDGFRKYDEMLASIEEYLDNDEIKVYQNTLRDNI